MKLKFRKHGKNLNGGEIKSIVFLAIGTNLGDREKNLAAALNKISEDENCEILSISSIYETKPYGELNQSNFLNMVAKISTTLSPSRLVMTLQSIEKSLGRLKREKWREREIDIDILLFDRLVVKEAGLKIPHYDLTNRDFFVLPLLEIEGEITNPIDGKLLKELEFNPSNRYILSKHSEK